MCELLDRMLFALVAPGNMVWPLYCTNSSGRSVMLRLLGLLVAVEKGPKALNCAAVGASPFTSNETVNHVFVHPRLLRKSVWSPI